MSGLSEIIQWTEKEIDLELFNQAGEAYTAISDIFVNDNRNDLDSILLDEKSEYLGFLRERIEDIPQSQESDDPFQDDLGFAPEITQALVALFG